MYGEDGIELSLYNVFCLLYIVIYLYIGSTYIMQNNDNHYTNAGLY